MPQPENKTETQPIMIEVFTKTLNNYSWQNLTEEDLKKLRRQAIKIEPAATIPAAITQLITALSANVSPSKRKEIKIQETYSYLLNWALQEKCKEAIIFLIDQGTVDKLKFSDLKTQEQPNNVTSEEVIPQSQSEKVLPEPQYVKVIVRCIAQNAFEIAATIIEYYKDKLSNETVLKFLYDAYNNLDIKNSSEEFDSFILTLLQINKVTVPQLEELAKPDPLLTFLSKCNCLNTFHHFVGKNINAEDKNGRSPLYHAIEGGNATLIDILKKKGAESVIFDDYYLKYKLNSYIKNNNQAGLIYLIKHCKPEEILLFKDSSEKFLIHYFSERNDVDSLKLIFEIFNKFKNIKNSNFSSELAIELHKSTLGKYLNVLVSHNNHTAIYIATVKKHLATLKLLLEEKEADPNIPNHEGRTALHHAARYDLCEYAQILLANKADPNIQTYEGDTPLHDAVKAKNESVVRLLLDHGANPLIANNQRKKPSDLADPQSRIRIALITKEKMLEKSSAQKSIFTLSLTEWGKSFKKAFSSEKKPDISSQVHTDLNL